MPMNIRPIDYQGLKTLYSRIPDSRKTGTADMSKKLITLMAYYDLHFKLPLRDKQDTDTPDSTDEFFSVVKTPFLTSKNSDFFFLFETIDWIAVLFTAGYKGTDYTGEEHPLFNTKVRGEIFLKTNNDLNDFIDYYSNLVHLIRQRDNSIGFSRIYYSASFYNTVSFINSYRYFTGTLFPKILEKFSVDTDYLTSTQGEVLLLTNRVLENLILEDTMFNKESIEHTFLELENLISISNIDRFHKNRTLEFDSSLYDEAPMSLDKLLAKHIFLEHTLAATRIVNSYDKLDPINKEEDGRKILPNLLQLSYNQKVTDYSEILLKNPIQYVNSFFNRIKRSIISNNIGNSELFNTDFKLATFIAENKSLISNITSNQDEDSAKQLLINLDKAIYPLYSLIPPEKLKNLLESIELIEQPLYIQKTIYKNYENSESPEVIAQAYKNHKISIIDNKINELTRKRELLDETPATMIMSDLKRQLDTLDAQPKNNYEQTELAKSFIRVMLNKKRVITN